MSQRKLVLEHQKITGGTWADAPDDGEQEYVIGINFRPQKTGKVKTTNLMIFSIFEKFCNFHLNL